ncbi:MAG: hypothetical protein HY665_07750 [Chloroflexi bacterium]|nr:hypothetical protein [Chloroflexota bacterium]
MAMARRTAIDKVIASILLIIASVVGVVLVVNAVYPAIGRSSSALVSAAEKMDERIQSDISIIQATGELDTSGVWQDGNSDGNFDVFIWVKNIGAAEIQTIGKSDVFFGEEGNFSLIPYVDYAGGSYPSWEYQIENGTRWGTATTVRININYSSALPQGNYIVKVVVRSGVLDDYYFSM